MRILLLYLFTLITILPSTADDKQLYLISGYPSYKFDYTYPCILYSLKDNQLVEMYEIYDFNTGISYIRTYHDERMVVIEKGYYEASVRDLFNEVEFETYRSQFPNVKIIKMNNPQKIWNEYNHRLFPNNSHLINNDNKLYLARFMDSSSKNEYVNQNGYSLYGIDINTKVINYIPVIYINHVKVSCGHLPYIKNGNDSINMVVLSQGIMVHTLSKTRINYILPNEYQFKEPLNNALFVKENQFASI